MKKLFLLTTVAMISWGARAQNSTVGTAKHNQPVDQIFGKVVTPERSSGSTQKGTAGGSRWFDHITTITALAGTQLTETWCPIWKDSTIIQTYTSGPDRINYSSLAQVIAPAGWSNHGYKLWADNNVYTENPIVLSGGEPYKVDSVSFKTVYYKNENRPSNIVDTLVIAAGVSTGYYFFPKTTYNWAGTYMPSTKDTLFASAPYYVDSVTRAVGATPSQDYQIWKILLTDADRDTAGLGAEKIWNLEIPNGGIDVPANQQFAFSVTFRSGDTWTPNVDTFYNFHHMRVASATIGQGATMSYKWYEYGDKNGSSLMFSTQPSRYLPTVAIEGLNDANFFYEYHQMAAHVVCSTCVTLSVENTVGNITNSSAYPNPAVTHVYVPFKLNQSANVTVSLTNALGQVVKSVNMGNVDKGQPEFNIVDLANGLYFYVVEANGERSTGRVVVAH